MTDTMTGLLGSYLACWNSTDPTTRRALLDANWSTRASYVDPMAEASGLDAIDATIAAVQAQFPGWVFTPAGQFDAHHNQARFSWGFGPDGAEPPIVGFDVVVTDRAGRIETVLGFLDRVPGQPVG